MKKKLGALIGLATCVTIGGVYATWSYAGTNDIADVSTNIQFSIPAATLAGANGTYTVESNVSITIDEETPNSYKTALYYTNTATKATAADDEVALTVTFTPAAVADYTIRAEGITSYFHFAMGDNTAVFADMNAQGEYLDENDAVVDTMEAAKKVDIFTFTYTATNKQTINVYTETPADGDTAERWTKQDDGSFVYEITFGELKGMISIDAFILDTKAEHDAFSSVLSTAKMNFIVGDGITS